MTDEIHKYFENLKERRIISDQIALSEQMIKAIEEKDYVSLMRNIEEFDSVYESNKFISKTKCKDIYFGLCFLTNKIVRQSNFYFEKRDLDKRTLEIMHKRPINNIKHSSEIESDLFKSMDKKMHHGGRKNS